MKFILSCLILICLSLSSFADPGAVPATPSPAIVDRRALFLKAYQLMPAIFETAIDMAFFNNELNGIEMQTFQKIRAVVLQDFVEHRMDRLQFSSDQNIFKLDPNQPIRTAATSDDPRDPIYVNLKVINDPQSTFELEDVVQILVHEYGHKTTDKIQTVVDTLAAKMHGFIMPYISRAISGPGERLTALFLPDMVGGDSLSKLTEHFSDKQKALLRGTMLFQNQNGIGDVSDAWSSFIVDHAMYKPRRKEIRTGSNHKVWQLALVKSDQDEVSFAVDFASDGVANQTGRLANGDLPEHRAQQLSQDLKAELVLDRKERRAKSVFLQQALTPQDHLSAELGYLNQPAEDVYEIGVVVNTPFDFHKVQLVIEGKDEHFSVSPKYVWPGHERILFEVKIPRTKEVMTLAATSFTTDDRANILLKQGVSFKTIAAPVSDAPMRVKSLRFSDGESEVQPNSRQPLEGKHLQLKMLVESPQDLLEIRIGERSGLSVLNPSSHGHIASAVVDSESFSYLVKHLDSTQFTQVRKGSMLEVTVPMPDSVFDKLPFDGSKIIIARDDGARALSNIELIDSSLRSVRLGGEGKAFSYQLKTPHKVFPTPILCREILF